MTGAGIFAAVGGSAVAVLDTATFVAVALALVLLRLREPRPDPPELHWLTEMGAGARHIFEVRRCAAACWPPVSRSSSSDSPKKVGFAVNQCGLHRPPSFVGVLVAVQGESARIGGSTAGLLVRSLGEQLTVGIRLATNGIGLAGSLTSSLPVVLAAEIVLGAGLPWMIVAFYPLLQRLTPGRLMGRVSAATVCLSAHRKPSPSR